MKNTSLFYIKFLTNISIFNLLCKLWIISISELLLKNFEMFLLYFDIFVEFKSSYYFNYCIIINSGELIFFIWPDKHATRKDWGMSCEESFVINDLHDACHRLAFGRGKEGEGNNKRGRIEMTYDAAVRHAIYFTRCRSAAPWPPIKVTSSWGAFSG